MHTRNFIKLSNHTNIILVSVPHRYDIMHSSFVNNEIRSFNRKLMKSVRAHQHASILEMSSDRKLFTNHGLHLSGLGKEVLSKQSPIHIYNTRPEKGPPPIILNWNSDLIYTDSLHQRRVANRTSSRTNSPPPSRKSDDFFMVNDDLNVGNDANTKQLCQKRDGNHHKVNQPNKGTIYFKIFYQNMRGLEKKTGEVLSHLHPDFPHVLCLTERHLKYLQLGMVRIENYNLGTHYCRQLREKGGVAIFVHNSLGFSNINIAQHCKDQDIEICALNIFIWKF